MIYDRKKRLLKTDVERVEKVKWHIENHLKDNLETEHLAQVFSVSSVTLNRHFEYQVGLSIYRFVLKSRMEQSMKSIVENDGTLSEIAAKVGFRDYSVFSRAFKLYYGKSPSFYLKKNQES